MAEPDEKDPVTRTVNRLVTERPWTVVAVFLLLTAGFAVGIGTDAEQQAGADQFTEDIEEFEAFEEMEEAFATRGREGGGAGATVFVRDDRNVLSEQSLLRMLEAQQRLEDRDRLRITGTSSPASTIARELDPGATTVEAQQRAIERASPRQLREAIQQAEEQGALGGVSTDLNPSAGSASTAQLQVSYDLPAGAGQSDRAALQYRTIDVLETVDGYTVNDNVVVFADALLEDEILQLLNDTAIVVFPAAILLIVFFLVLAYRDPVDLGVGVAALVMTLVWTFGFMGYAGIPFGDTMVTIFPLLLAVGIDFGIHIINRYREERQDGAGIDAAMTLTTRQLTAAFLIVTITTVFSFAANLTSPLGSLQDFGLVAAAGITFTFLIFGVFLPAAKVGFDRLREGRGFPQFGTKPLGREGSLLGVILPAGVSLARVGAAGVLIVALVGGGAAGAYGTGVDTEFSQEVFFPNEERIEQYERLPEPFKPGTYSFLEVISTLENDFDQGFIGSVTLYIEGPEVRSDATFREIDRATRDPPPAFAGDRREADASSVLSVTHQHAAENPEFGALVRQTDTTGNGVPDRDADRVFESLLDSPRGDQARSYLTDDRSATRIQFQLTADADATDATRDARLVADRFQTLEATPTGQIVVNQAVIDRITESAIVSLFVAFGLTAVFLAISYRLLEGRAIYGIINLVPVVVTVALLAGSMRLFDISLTPINAPILAVSIGLGVDYTVHFMHRFVDEFDGDPTVDVYEALLVTVRGTGGALTGSMLTTVTGIGVLYVALIPLIAEFGILIALGVLYAYLAAILLLPATIVVWVRAEAKLRGVETAAV
ncbi:putative RND superfamily exporter [Halalkaliarchaeum desulfuricum]|uniref:Putative RND superfamily exporter n=1 Tax=Halalkaliarchaeum desulfuricum TaxID=2055893 RepID=A0A343TNN4_9EURY|nr:MMPL family transporter [Halalkaliarchaeum desulfuricum]AUX10706.1 putative RND superfamily exporter [Halalkaliarchaeum desulfuricum]